MHMKLLGLLYAVPLVALAAAGPMQAQQPAGPGIQIAVSRTASLPDGGWKWAEAVRTQGLRVSVPVRGSVVAWAGAAQAENQMYACLAIEAPCTYSGNLWMLSGGAEYRFRAGSAVVPFAGAGANLEYWTNGGRTWMPHVHAGVDLFATRNLGLRLQAESEWQFPARVGAGVVIALP
jgi:hypothetical protein